MDKQYGIKIMYHKDPEKPSQWFEFSNSTLYYVIHDVFMVDGITYYMIDQNARLVFAIGIDSGTTGRLAIPAKVVCPNDGLTYTVMRIYGCFAYYSKISDIVVPENVTVVNNSAFCACGELQTITLPSSLRYVFTNVIWDCPQLKAIYMNASVPPQIVNEDIQSTDDNLIYPNDQSAYDKVTLYIPEGSYDAYAASPWNRFKHIVERQKQIVGDVNGDGRVDISDVITLLGIIAAGE